MESPVQKRKLMDFLVEKQRQVDVNSQQKNYYHTMASVMSPAVKDPLSVLRTWWRTILQSGIKVINFNEIQ